MPQPQFDRAAQVLSATSSYRTRQCLHRRSALAHILHHRLGYTRDPYLNTGAGNMWVNVGMSQFSPADGQARRLRGVTGLVMPDRERLLHRLNRGRRRFDGTKFEFRESNDGVETVCPVGNRITVHTPDVERFGRIQLGMPYVRFDVRPGTAERIARFYREVMDVPAEVKKKRRRPRGASGRREAIFLFPRDRRRRKRTTTGIT